MKNYKEVTIIDCEYMYRFMNKAAVCSNGEVVMFSEERED